MRAGSGSGGWKGRWLGKLVEKLECEIGWKWKRLTSNIAYTLLHIRIGSRSGGWKHPISNFNRIIPQSFSKKHKNHKGFFLVLLILLFTSAQGFSQKLEVDEVDEFKKIHVKKTSFFTLHDWNFTAYLRVVKLGEVEFLELKFMKDNIQTINEGAEFLFLFDNDEVLTVKNNEYASSCQGCGSAGLMGSSSFGINTFYKIDQGQHDKLKKNLVAKIRIYSNQGYVDGKVKSKGAKSLQNALKLVE